MSPENLYVTENNSSFENIPVTSLESNKDQDKMNYVNSICTDFSVNFTFVCCMYVIVLLTFVSP